MAKPGKTGLTRIIHAWGYSMKGLRAAFIHESAFRQETLLAVLLLPLAFWLGSNTLEYILLAGSVLLVLVVELLNSAIEAVVDRIGDEHHELSGRAKDIGSAAVLISLCLTGLVWGLILFEHI
ncbi:MAG TPA: diacylglycerol kinase [Gammaproteobacteria bacterium]|nr:diacylglycerol kinase [Gammaproteobacteria bacterium]